MPVRFQVDPDFYDHPKVLSMSDAAFALWVRAGSYSAAKHTDGFIADDVLSLFSPTQQAAAPELVTRRLWRRVKGGFRFHQYEERNLMKARVDADREYDRDRKRRERAEKRPDKRVTRPPVDNSRDPDTSDTEQQANGQIVRTGHQPDSGPDSDRNPSRSVSVSVSGSVSGSGHDSPPSENSPPPAQEPPPQVCPKHLDDPNPPPCGACADARRRRAGWDLAEAERRRHAPRCRKHPDHRGEPAHNCGLCRADALAKE